jgi:MoaA/NifB/PqqE/SkfB family radical SAM enzyme
MSGVAADAPPTPERLPTTRRGVLWLGLHCNVRCEFCYDDRLPASRKEWVDFDAITAALTKFRRYYGNDFVDFMGGEPTLHPHIVAIVEHCAAIGLRPTLITHGMRLADPTFATRLRDAGLHDVLMSVHGVGDTLQRIHQRGRDNHERQLLALANLRELGVPVRFNVTVVQKNVGELVEIAELACRSGARVVNFLTFNPYFEWRAEADIPFQVRHSDAAPQLAAAIDVLTRGGVEGNVRYFPICVLRGHEQHVFTGHQLPYDEHEWDYNSWYDRGVAGAPAEDWYRAAAATQRERHDYVHAKPCQGCAAREICDGVHEQYLARFGDGELRPYDGQPLTDPTHFVASQPVVVRESPPPAPCVDFTLADALDLTQFADELEHRAGGRREDPRSPDPR